MSDTVRSRALALRKAKEIGCSGAHEHEDGWMPCATHDEWLRATSNPTRESKGAISEIEERRSRRTKKGRRRKKRQHEWQKLRERGVTSIDTLSSGGLVSGTISGGGMSTKSTWAPMDGDADVFTDIRTARRRSRQLGCIGVARRTSRNGNTVWTPCSNMTDYQKRTGSTAFGRQRREAEEMRKLKRRLRKLRRGKSLMEELYEGKALGRKLRAATARFDPNAIDGDEDGMVQDGTAFQRPALPNKPDMGRDGFASRNSDPDLERMTEQELADYVEIMTQEPPSFEELEAGAKKFYEENPGFLEDEPELLASAPESVRQGFASATRQGRTIAVGSGGKKMRDMIIGRVSENARGKPKGQRRLYFIGGTAGSGKSTIVEDNAIGVPDRNSAAHIDPDEIKKGLVGYDNGRGAQAVHSASRKTADRTMDAAAEEGMDMVVQGLGKRTEHLEMARRNGYKTSGHFAHVPGAVADERILQREQAGGTRLPRGYGTSMQRYMQNTVPRQITAGLYDEFTLWDTEGKPPKKIAEAKEDGTYVIYDRAKFDGFFGFTGGSYVEAYWKKQAAKAANRG